VFNSLYYACQSGYCSASCIGKNNGSTSLSLATDGSPYTAGVIFFSQGEGRSWVKFLFPYGPSKSTSNIYIRGIWPVNTTLSALTSTGDELFIKLLDPSVNYLDLNLLGPNVSLSGLILQSVTRDGVMRGYCYAGVGDCKQIMVTEIASQIEPCYEQLTIDLSGLKLLQSMTVQYNGFSYGYLSVSVDGLSFVRKVKIVPSWFQSKVSLNNITASFARFRLILIYIIFFFLSIFQILYK
jgi:hypothetical protein